MAEHPKAVLAQLTKSAERARKSGDREDVLDVIELFREKEATFTSTAATNSRECMDYFEARINLETLPELGMTDHDR